MAKRYASLLAAGALAACLAAAEPCDLSRVRLLDGPFRTIQELHRTGWLAGMDVDRLLFPYRKAAGLPQPAGVQGYGGWDASFCAGHMAAHFLSGAARMHAATGDAVLKERAVAMVVALAACQERMGGFLAAFPEEKLAQHEQNPRKTAIPFYLLHKILAGLLDVHEWCGDGRAFLMAERLADHLAARMAKLPPERIEAMLRTDYSGNPTNEFGGMAEALADLCRLARKRGDAQAGRHLVFAQVFNRPWLMDPLLAGQDRLDGLHGNTHVAQVSGMACCAAVDFKVGGDDRNVTAASAFWRLVTADHSFVIGGNGFDEKLRAARTEVAGSGPAALSPQTAETCNTHNMLKLSRHLFCRAPRAAYADYMESALWNHILASIAPDSGRVTYFLPLRPGDFRTYLEGTYCCQGTGLENAARFGEGIWFHDGAHLWLNQFIASTLDWREQGLRLTLTTGYPATGQVRLAVQAPTPVQAAIHVRIPSWVQGEVEVLVDGTQVPAAPVDGYVTLDRRWRDGEVVELRFPVGLRIRPAIDDPTTVTIFHGPLVLAGELGRTGMPASDCDGKDRHVRLPAVPVPVFVSPTPTTPALAIEADAQPMTYRVRMMGPDRQPVVIRFAPLFQVHHQRFAVYWKVQTPEQFAATPTVPAAPTATSFIGDAAAEKERNLQGERTTTGTFQGRAWRDAAPGGWFSYRLPVDGAGDLDLVCTYWGGDTGNRVFDILVEDQCVATQRLEGRQPGAFIDHRYRIPATLVAGRQFVTVRFQPHPGAKAGGLFDCRIVPPKS